MIWVGLVFYFVIIVSVGFYAKKASKNSFDDFAVAGRSMKGIVLGLSEAASLASAWLWFGWVGMGYTYGTVALWYAVPVTLTAMAIWLWVAPAFREKAAKNGSVGIGDFLATELGIEDKHLERIYRGVLGAIILYFMFMYAGSQFNALGAVFSNLTGIDKTPALIIGAVIVVVYTFVGGFRAVVWTDFVQSILVIFGLSAVLISIFAQLGGIGGFMQQTAAVSPDFVSINGGFLFGGLLLWILAWASAAISFFGQPHAAVRWLAVSSKGECYKGAVVATFFEAFRMVIPVLIGMGVRVIYPALTNPENAVLVLTNDIIHPLLGGLILGGIIAATMSTADSQLLEAVNNLSRNIYQRLLNKDDDSVLNFSRWGIIVIAGLGVLGALLRPDTIFGAVQYAFVGLGAALGPVLLMILFARKSITIQGGMAGSLMGSVGFIIFKTMLDRGVFPEALDQFLQGRESLALWPLVIVTILVVSAITKKSSAGSDVTA